MGYNLKWDHLYLFYGFENWDRDIYNLHFFLWISLPLALLASHCFSFTWPRYFIALWSHKDFPVTWWIHLPRAEDAFWGLYCWCGRNVVRLQHWNLFSHTSFLISKYELLPHSALSIFFHPKNYAVLQRSIIRKTRHLLMNYFFLYKVKKSPDILKFGLFKRR